MANTNTAANTESATKVFTPRVNDRVTLGNVRHYKKAMLNGATGVVVEAPVCRGLGQYKVRLDRPVAITADVVGWGKLYRDIEYLYFTGTDYFV